jgi:hypothetical protein
MAEVAEFVVACTVRKAEALPSHTESAGLMPRRLEVEASSEDVDGEGDKVLQKALLASAEEFIACGDIDLEHISKMGKEILGRLPAHLRFGDPMDYVIGKPFGVRGIEGGRTLVTAEIFRGRPAADWFWDSLESGVEWKASIYGTVLEADPGEGGVRMVVKALRWTSLAMTRNPVNRSLVGSAKVLKAEMDRVIRSFEEGGLPVISGGKVVKGYGREKGVSGGVDTDSIFWAHGLPSVEELFYKWTFWRLCTGTTGEDVKKNAERFLGTAAKEFYPILKAFMDRNRKTPLYNLYLTGLLDLRRGETGRVLDQSGIFGSSHAEDRKDVFTVHGRRK